MSAIFFRLHVFGIDIKSSICWNDAYKAQDCRYLGTSRAFPVFRPVQYTRNRSLRRYKALKSESHRYSSINRIFGGMYSAYGSLNNFSLNLNNIIRGSFFLGRSIFFEA